MAGYTNNEVVGEAYCFHIDTPNVGERIRQANNMRRVITLQLDGDELDAALWGLENYVKGVSIINRQPDSSVRCKHGEIGILCPECKKGVST